MKFALTILATVALVFLFTPIQAHAQATAPVTLLTTHTVPASGTSNYTAVVNVPRSATVGILTQSTLSGSGTDDIVWSFSKSADGATFETTPSVLITNTSNGTTTVNKYTAVDVSGVYALKLVSVVNNSSSRVLTNVVYAYPKILSR